MLDAVELLGLSGAGLLWYAGVVLLGGFMRGYSGFGFSAVLMAGLGLLFDPAGIVPIAVALEVMASVGQARRAWPAVDWRHFSVLLATGAVGNPLGVWLLAVAPGDALRVGTYLFIAAASALLLVSPRLNVALSWPVLAAAGLLAGAVNGATALSGLVLALLFAVSGISPATMRATLIAYFFVTDLWAGLFVAAAGLYGATTLWRIAVALPLLAVGLWLGGRRFLRASPASFRAFTLQLLIGLCVLGLGRLLIARSS